MNCEKFIALAPQERNALIGKLNHIVQSDNRFFEIANQLIDIGERAGLLENVEILFQMTVEETIKNPIFVP